MKKQIKKIVNNQRGSALAFVLIVGMVLMILLGSLMVLANRGIIFTQESVESRQAYADAKSVIEFGKNYINKNINERFEGEDVAEFKKASGEETIFNIYGSERKKADDALSFSTEETLENTVLLGTCKLKWEKTRELPLGVPGEPEDSTKYSYELETQNLRRKLDFKCTFDYDAIRTGSGGVPLEPMGGQLITIKTNGYKFENEEEKNFQGNSKIEYNDLNLKIKSMEWPHTNKELEVKAKNIAFPGSIYTTINGQTSMSAQEMVYITGGYEQTGNAVKKITAKEVVVKGDLALGKGSHLSIVADKVWIGGKVVLNENSSLTIKGNNEVIINGSKNTATEDINTFKSGSSLIVNGEKIWINKDINSDKTPSKNVNLEFTGVNYLEMQSVYFGGNTNSFTVEGKGTAGTGNNRVFLENLKTVNNLEFVVSNLYSFTGNSINLTNSKITFSSKILDIKELTINDDSIQEKNIVTEYLFCEGKTSVGGSGVINIMPPPGKNLNVYIKGAYEQKGKQILATGCEQVVFGGDVNLSGNGNLSMTANKLYFDGITSVDINAGSSLNYAPLVSPTGMTINLRTKIGSIPQGIYTNVALGINFTNLSGKSGQYVSPSLPDKPLPIPTNSETGKEIPNSEIKPSGAVVELTTEYY